MKKLLLLFCSFALLTSCSKDDETKDLTTSAEITLKNSSNAAVSGMTVYAYDQTTWEMIGDDVLFAKFQSTSNEEGKAIFSNLDSGTTFNDLNNNQNNFRFSVHYSKAGAAKAKFISITVKKGENKTGLIILD